MLASAQPSSLDKMMSTASVGPARTREKMRAAEDRRMVVGVEEVGLGGQSVDSIVNAEQVPCHPKIYARDECQNV